jgi:1-acyl-sn-glycerol-3-phosphate acyltransferase
VISLGTGVRGTTVTAVPWPRSRLDVVFGPPVVLPAVPVRSRMALEAARVRLQAALTAHHAHVVKMFGRAATVQHAPAGTENT